MEDSVEVETALFDHRVVKPHFINPCCFGEDFAAWLPAELASFGNVGLSLSEPIQEDYGWGLWASREKERLWIALGYVGDGPQEEPAHWIISVSESPSLAKLFQKPDHKTFALVRDAIRRALESKTEIKIVPSE